MDLSLLWPPEWSQDWPAIFLLYISCSISGSPDHPTPPLMGKHSHQCLLRLMIALNTYLLIDRHIRKEHIDSCCTFTWESKSIRKALQNYMKNLLAPNLKDVNWTSPDAFISDKAMQKRFSRIQKEKTPDNNSLNKLLVSIYLLSLFSHEKDTIPFPKLPFLLILLSFVAWTWNVYLIFIFS